MKQIINKSISNDSLYLSKNTHDNVLIFDIYLRSIYIGNISYSGDNNNVSYYILDQFRNRGYATKSLSLLIELFKTEEYNYIKEISLSIEIDNIYSQKVMLNNGGKLVKREKGLNTYIIKIR